MVSGNHLGRVDEVRQRVLEREWGQDFFEEWDMETTKFQGRIMWTALAIGGGSLAQVPVLGSTLDRVDESQINYPCRSNEEQIQELQRVYWELVDYEKQKK